MNIKKWIEDKFAGYGIALRRENDAPIDGDPFMSMDDAKRICRNAISEALGSPLSSDAVDTLGQLYVSGPTWDGNVASKVGRGELVENGLAWHAHGYASLTPEGVCVAVGWNRAYLKRHAYSRWLEKLRES